MVRTGRIDGVGDLELRIEAKNGIIQSVNILGDYMLVGNLNQLLDSMKGIQLNENALNSAIQFDLEKIIMNLNKNDFINLIINKNHGIY